MPYRLDAAFGIAPENGTGRAASRNAAKPAPRRKHDRRCRPMPISADDNRHDHLARHLKQVRS